MLPWIETDLPNFGLPPSISQTPSMDSQTVEKIYAFRPSIPATPEEASDMILEKLEQAGRVPSKDKFRRMACNVGIFFFFFIRCPHSLTQNVPVTSLRPLFSLELVLTMIDVSPALFLVDPTLSHHEMCCSVPHRCLPA